MKVRQKIIVPFFVILSVIVTFSCNKTEMGDDRAYQTSVKGGEGECFMLGKQLDNPYSVENMQAVYDSLWLLGRIGNPIQIRTTHRYIKLTPKDSAEMNKILSDTTLELFPYPLDYEIVGEGEYEIDEYDTSASLYTVIPVSHHLESGINYIVLDECFIPDDNDDNPDLEQIELEALLRTGNLAPEELSLLNGTKSLVPPLKYPKGYVKVKNAETDDYEPVRNIKVRVRRGVKIASAYTNDNGYYSIGKGFRYDVHYSAVFENKRGFKIWSNLGPISPAIHNVGWHSNTGYDITIGKSSCAWAWATINNAALDYYDVLCPYYNIRKPYKELRFWYLSGSKVADNIGGGKWTGSAPMLRNITLNAAQFAAFFYLVGMLEEPAMAKVTVAVYCAMLCLPDIFLCKMKEPSTINMRSYVFHEMSHASHYMQVGSEYWLQYIGQICYNGIATHGENAYGDSCNGHNNIIGVGEMWGNYFAYKCTDGYYGYGQGLKHTGAWYAPQILKTIEDNAQGITPKKIYDALMFWVRSHEDLKQELIFKYGQSDIINQAFSDSGF